MPTIPNNVALNPLNMSVGKENCNRHSLTIPIDFSIGLTYSLDLTAIQQQLAYFKTVQTLYIDNSQNGNAITILMGGTLQRVIIPAFGQGYVPVLQIEAAVLTFQSASAVQIAVQVLDFFLPPFIWSANGNSPITPGGVLLVSDAILDATVSGGRVNTNAIAPTIQGLTDASGTIAVGGTAQSAIPASATRSRWIISNPAAATEPLFISFASGATGQITLLAGQTWDESGSSIVGDAVFVNAATAAHAFTAYYK
jgi:hypothetical protein